ncbi:MAG: 7-carboxy-7-deazaguanine synthase [Burkholderiales bacterium]
MTYAVKEIFYTLQGEGMNAGRPAIFCRFAGCNLWSGEEKDRATAVCRFCDTAFVGVDGDNGGKYADAAALSGAIAAHAPAAPAPRPMIVLTGGEPALQVDQALVDALHAEGFTVAIETNGTLPLQAALDWVCVSPKAATELAVREGDELKLVYRQAEAAPERFETLAFRHFLLQPMDGLDRERFTAEAIAYCKAHPQWRLSLQTHKILGIS